MLQHRRLQQDRSVVADYPDAMAPPIPPGRSFTIRGVAAGLAVGTVICAANVYFGLQTGWVSIMSMPASLMGYGIFKLLSPHLSFPFTPVENVLVQSVACGMAIMPLGCGLVGVVSPPFRTGLTLSPPLTPGRFFRYRP